MLNIKPFLRITVLSIILTSMLIYLGVTYHWGDHLNIQTDDSIELTIPESKRTDTKINTAEKFKYDSFDPEIVESSTENTLLESMNKEQITEQCINLLSKDLKDPLTLELASVNCVVSNYQETFQNSRGSNEQIDLGVQKKKLLFKQQCSREYNQSTQYSMLEKRLLIGICVSDNLSTI